MIIIAIQNINESLNIVVYYAIKNPSLPSVIYFAIFCISGVPLSFFKIHINIHPAYRIARVETVKLIIMNIRARLKLNKFNPKRIMKGDRKNTIFIIEDLASESPSYHAIKRSVKSPF